MTSSSFSDQYVQVRSIRTRYWQQGDSGPNIILLHGIGGSVEMWQKNIQTLAKENRVYALDMVGFGYTDKPDAAYTLSFQADFVHSFMNAVNLETATLVGLSLGGGVALDFSLRYPQRLDMLVLVDSAGLGREMHILFRLPTLPLIGEWLTRPSRQRTRELLDTCYYDPTKVSDEMVDFYYALSSQPGAQRAFLTTLRVQGSFGGLREMILGSILRGLKRLDIPTLLVWGQEDEILPLEHARQAHQRLPDSRLEIIDHCGHLPPMEQPEKFNQAVLDFLNIDGRS